MGTSQDDLDYVLLLMASLFFSILGKLGLHAWLVLPTISRAFLWMVISCTFILSILYWVEKPSRNSFLAGLSLPLLSIETSRMQCGVTLSGPQKKNGFLPHGR